MIDMSYTKHFYEKLIKIVKEPILYQYKILKYQYQSDININIVLYRHYKRSKKNLCYKKLIGAVGIN